jgi:hypothetical protein
VHDALTLVLRRLELDPPVFHADEFRDGLEPWRVQLEAAGVLQRIAASASASCPYCCDDSPRRVIFVENGQADGKRGFLSCPECGVFEVPPERLQRWTVDVRGFLSHAFAGSGATVRPVESVEGRLWHVGKATWAGRSREVWFGRAFRSALAADITRPLQSRPKAIVFAPTDMGAERWRGATKNLVIALESTLSEVDGALRFDKEYVDGRIIDAGMGPDVESQQRPKKRGPRTAKIELLKIELVKHLRAARDHAFFTKDETGTPELLPRPTQQDLGVRVGLSKSDVSRSFSDEDAGELRLYWNVAADLDEIMRWQGGVKRHGKRTRKRPLRHPEKASATRT